MNRLKLKTISIFLLLIALVGCGAETGELTIVANGEDFVRQGFVSKDGWQIQFDHVYVTIEGATAYATDPPYDASTGEQPDGTSASAEGTTTLDLALGGEDADPITLASLETEVGQYNAIGWEMVNDESGTTIQMVGSAEKEGTTIAFDIQVIEEYDYVCGEFIGDERKGFVEADQPGDIEMTFHFDHVFGDGDAPADDSINTGALGFDSLAALATDNELNVTTADLQSSLSAADFDVLMETLGTLGHVGEGHCYEASAGYTDKESE